MNTYTENAKSYASHKLSAAQWIDEALAEVDGLEPMTSWFEWRYAEPDRVDASDADRRAVALRWLRRHSAGLHAIVAHARTEGVKCEVRKVADDHEFGLTVWLSNLNRSVSARVPASLTCELVPTGEMVERMDRRCVESIFAGIEDDVEVAS